MGRVLCTFNSVNGQNTGVYTRKGMGKSYPSAGILLKKNCTNGQFYIESTDGGTNNYYRLVDANKYTGIDASGPVYVPITSEYLVSPNPSQVQALGNSSSITTSGPGNSGSSSSSPNSNPSQPITSPNSSSGSTGFDQIITNMLNDKSLKSMMNKNTRVFGAPFQFTNTTDYRPFTDDVLSGYGRKYLENIIAEAPIVYFTPGLPDYMPDSNKKVRETIDEYIKTKQAGTSISSGAMSNVYETAARYYGFIGAYAEYIRYVNLLCRVCAQYMDLGGDEHKVPGTNTPYDKFNWGRWTNLNMASTDNKFPDASSGDGIFDRIGNAFEDAITSLKDSVTNELFGEYRYIQCYVDPSASFSESSSNSTQASMIAGLFDSLESIVKEIGFFSNGSGLLSGVTDALQTGTSSIAGGTTNLLDSDVSAGLSKIIGNATHVVSGSNIVFPELWNDSNYNKSYNFTIDLVSPYGDKESCYMNIIVPMMHLIALSMPRQTSANSFGSPFLVKVFSKGWFSCDLGIIDSISFEKSDWNVHGLPNRVKVQLSVKDLYTSLFISKSSTPGMFFQNQGLIEFLAVTSGLNITQGDLALKLDTIINSFSNMFTDMGDNLYQNMIQGIRNYIEGWFKITK